MRKRKMIVAALAMLACANSPQTVWAQQHDANQAAKVENGPPQDHSIRKGYRIVG